MARDEIIARERYMYRELATFLVLILLFYNVPTINKVFLLLLFYHWRKYYHCKTMIILSSNAITSTYVIPLLLISIFSYHHIL